MSRLKLITRVFVVLCTLLAASSAWAVPMQLAHQGRLLDTGGSPLEDDHDLTFTLYDAADDGAVVWSEEIGVQMTGGFYSVVLGADEDGNPLDDLVFGGGRLWLELAVDDGEPLAPRQEIVSVPFAIRAETATNVEGGVVDATEIAVDGEVVIDSTGAWVGTSPAVDWAELTGVPEDADTLAGLSCSDGARPRWDGLSGLWACDAVAWDELVDVPGELLDGDADTLGGLVSCVDGGIPVFDLTSGLWGCGTDAVLDGPAVVGFIDGAVVNLGVGSSMDGSVLATVADLDWDLLVDVPDGFADGEDADSLADLGLACADGDRPSWDLSGDVWVCAEDIDTVLTEDQVEDMVFDEPLDLPADSTLDGEPIATGSGGLFGGTGDDGALVITAGTTTLDLGGAAYFVRNYTSIEIGGTGQLNFINPHDAGTVIVLRSQGDVTLTSATVPSLDVTGLGATIFSNNYNWRPTGHLHASVSDATAPNLLLSPSGYYSSIDRAYASDYYLAPIELTRSLRLAAGSAGQSFGSALGGRGGGSLYIEAGGQLDFTAEIHANGLAGGVSSQTTSCRPGGGGGSAGRVVILYNQAANTSGAVVNEGGDGGTGFGDVGYCCNCMPGGRGAGGYGGSGGAPGTSCTACAGEVYGGAGGAGGGGPGLSPASASLSAPGGLGGPSGNNLVQQNTVFP